MRYTQRFDSASTEQAAIDAGQLGKPYVVYLEDEKRLDWNSKSATPPLSAQPLTIEIESASTITFKANGDDDFFGYMDPRTIFYSINNSDWISITSSAEGAVINVADGDVVKLKGDNQTYAVQSVYAAVKHTYFTVNGTFKLYGNPGSLLSSSAFTELTKFGQYSLAYLFKENTGLTEVTEIAFGDNMLTQSDNFCYYNMFNGCTSLNYVKCLADTTTGGAAFRNWLNGVAAAGTFVKHPDATWPTGRDGIPDGWTVIDADI